MNAALLANLYSTQRNSQSIIAAYDSKKLTATLEKTWSALNFLNDHTQGGFFKLRQGLDKADAKRASHYKVVNGQKIETGWMSQITGLTVDNPQKLRSMRTSLLIFEESGSWPDLRKAVIQGQALTGIMGNQFGIQIIGGTSGDSGPALEGIREIFYNPESYNVLPYKHSFTSTGETVLTGFFLPAQKCILDPSAGLLDSRGYTDPEKGVEYYTRKRQIMVDNPKQLMIYAAEYPFNDSEMFSLEGQNNFNQQVIASQLTRIRALKQCPKIETGTFRPIYKQTADHDFMNGNISDLLWVPNKNGPVQILEHPLWISQTIEEEDEFGNVNLVKSEAIEKQEGLYVIGIDAIDQGQEDTSSETRDASEFCCVVFRRAYGLRPPKFVAMYKERPQKLKDACKIAISLAIYYNALINLEATRVTLLSYAREWKFMKYFMRRPSATYSDTAKRRTNSFGTPATLTIINHQNDLLADYIDEYGENIWFEDMLVQMNRYSIENKRKFDCIAACGMAMLANEELSGTVPRVAQSYSSEFQDFGYYYDENGYKHYGVIPKQNQFITNYTNNFYNEFSYRDIKTSDPRFNW